MKMFWSYSRRDDQPPLNKVSSLRKSFETALSQAIGEDCEIFFDLDSIKWGSIWRNEIDRRIVECDCLVAIVTPSYFNSRMCVYELNQACSENKKILPIYFRECKTLKSTFKEDGLEGEVNQKLNKASLQISEAQMKDFRGLRNLNLDSREVQDFLDIIAGDIA